MPLQYQFKNTTYNSITYIKMNAKLLRGPVLNFVKMIYCTFKFFIYLK